VTLQQLKYVITVAETGTITEAANRLYISQPSLTNAVHELEREMNIVIFNRTNKGISLSKEGEDFLGYARQVLEQAAILEDKYKGNCGGKKQFCVSTQHYSFAVNAFVDLVKEYGQEEYDFSLRETQTYEIIQDVARMRSEIGILFLDDFNEAVINKILKSCDLEFHILFVARPHVFISRKHPLAEKEIITNEELENYPYLSFEQGEHNSFYFSEEIFSVSERKKNIRVRDRATLFNLLIGLNGYTVCSGVIDEKLNGKEIIAVPLDGEGDMRIGYITHRKGILSRLGKSYLEALSGYVKTKQPERKPEHRGRFNERNRNGGTICDTEKIVKEHIRKLK
jgi:DNA-binding transcriptional LysR family regulator